MLVEAAVGDAYGAGFEFRGRVFVRLFNRTDKYRRPPLTLVKPGRYTDDTQMMIAVAEALLSGDEWTPQLLASHFVETYKRDPRSGYAPGFQRFLRGVDSGDEFLARIKPTSKRSGAAMRAGPIGLFPNVKDVLEHAELQARVTHDTPEGIVSAQAAALMVHYFAYRLGLPGDLPAFIRSSVPGAWEQSWKGRVSVDGIPCVHAALSAVASCKSFTALLHRCVAYGGDVDTVATISLAAASWSDDYVSDLPATLIDGLESGPYGRSYLEHLDQSLIEWAQLTRPNSLPVSRPSGINQAVVGALVPPLFVLDGGDVDAFDSLDDLCRQVEPVDAARAGLAAFDSQGQIIVLRGNSVIGGRVFAGGGETGAEPSTADPDPEALMSALVSFVGRVGPDRFGVSAEWVLVAPLNELVGVVARFLRR